MGTAAANRSAAKRRSDVSRTRSTRKAVIEAAIDCLASVGPRGMTASALASRSGVSWGGIQYQFGDKGEIVRAALVQCMTHIGEQVQGTPTEGTVSERMHDIVTGAYAAVCAPEYRAFMMSLRASEDLEALAISPARLHRKMNQALERLWASAFPSYHLDASARELLNLVLAGTLDGMADQRQLGQIKPAIVDEQLEVLTDTLVRLLEKKGHLA